jgi:hypothetical protein
MNQNLIPWNRQPEENQKQFHAFQIFLELGKNRTYQSVAKNLNISKSTVKRYGKKFKWQLRALLFDSITNSKNKNQLYSLNPQQENLFKNKSDFSQIMQHIFNELYPHLINYEQSYLNESINEKINFINKMIKTFNSIIKTIDSNESDYFNREKYLRCKNIMNSLEFTDENLDDEDDDYDENNVDDYDDDTDSVTGIIDENYKDDDSEELNDDDDTNE